MPRRDRRKQAQKSDRKMGILLASVGMIFMSALGGAAVWVTVSDDPIDSTTNCPKSGPHSVHVVMFDRSDPIKPQQAQRIRQVLADLKDKADFGDRFDLYTFEGDAKNALSPVLEICSPGRNANPLIKNPGRVKQRYESRFSSVIDNTVTELLRDSTMPNSPIIESLRAASITSFGPFEKGQIPLRLTMISDMVQHTPWSSHFRSEPNFQQLSHTPTWASLRPNLKNADIDVLYVLRSEAKRGGVSIQSRGHQTFWEQLIASGGGRLTSFEPI